MWFVSNHSMERNVGWNFSNGLGRDYCCHKTTTWNVKIESLYSPQFCFFKRNTPCFFSIAWVNHQQPRSLWGLPKTCCFQMFGTDCTPGGYRESVALWNAELNRRDLNPIPSFWSWKQWYGRTCTTGQSQHEIPDLRMVILFEPFKNAGIWTVFILWCYRKNTPSTVLRCVFKKHADYRRIVCVMDLCNCIPGYFVFLKVPLSCSPALPYLLRRARSVYHRAWSSDLCCQRELSWIWFFTHKKTINRKRTPTWTLQEFNVFHHCHMFRLCFSSRGTESGWPWPSWLWRNYMFTMMSIQRSKINEYKRVDTSGFEHCSLSGLHRDSCRPWSQSWRSGQFLLDACHAAAIVTYSPWQKGGAEKWEWGIGP